MANVLDELKKFRRWVDSQNATCLSIRFTGGIWKAALFVEGYFTPRWVIIPAEIDAEAISKAIPDLKG